MGAGNVRELNIRVTLDRLVKGGYLVGRPIDRDLVQYRITQRGSMSLTHCFCVIKKRRVDSCLSPTRSGCALHDCLVLPVERSIYERREYGPSWLD